MKLTSTFILFFLSSCATQHCTDSKPSSGVWVYKYDQSRQCELSSGVSLETMSQDLESIKVLDQKKLSDGVPRITMCQAQTGKANLYLIKSTDQTKALELGFKVWDFPARNP